MIIRPGERKRRAHAMSWREVPRVLNGLSVIALLGAIVLHVAHAQTPTAEEQVAKSATTDPHDFAGMWEPKSFNFMVRGAQLLPDAQARVAQFAAERAKGRIVHTAWTTCRPGAVSAMVMPRETIMIMQSPAELTVLFEMPPMARRIRMNAEHPRKIEPSYVGDSVGHWEGNTLVIDSIGFNGHAELDAQGLPTSPKLHTVERLTKTADGNSIVMKITITDPVNYSEPITIDRTWIKSDKRHQLEYDCMENPREEDFENAVFLQDLYRPTCVRVEGKGLELSRVVCSGGTAENRKPDSK
jgi:hypothetical protein